MSPFDRPSIPPPQPVRHLSTLWWWLGLAGVLVLVDLVPRWITPTGASAPPAAQRASRASAAKAGSQDFLALMFGKIADGGPEALSPALLRAQLEQLKAAGGHAVRVEDVQAFLRGDRPLPPKAVLLAFDEAGRETIEAADPVLAALGWPALAFVSVEGVAANNINLVSRRRLEQMTQSGRWSVGIGACRGSAAAFDADAYRQAATELQSWAGQPALAVGCSGSLGATSASRWSTALKQAELPLGFLPHPTGVNRRGDSPQLLHFAQIGPGDRGPDALVRRAGALTPRDGPFVDEFGDARLDDGWIVDSGTARVVDGALRLGAAPGGTTVLTLAGSARWRDERIQVDLDDAPAGQFWIYARYGGQKTFVRLGTVNRQVVLQRSDSSGATRQLGASEAPPGKMRLTLSVIGGRAIATVDDRVLLERPVDLPDDLVEGPASLVVWGGDERTAARISRVEVAPVARQLVLMPAHPGEDSFERLRQLSGELWAVSPRRFRWRDGAGTETAPDPAVEILAGMHRVAMIPAVGMPQVPSGAELEKLRAQMLAWADRPQCKGLNLALEHVAPDDFARITVLREALAAVGKELVVTSADDTGDLETPDGLAWFIAPRSSGFVLATASAQRSPG